MMDKQPETETSSKNEGKRLNRLIKKPSMNRKPPEIKQTLTSKYRMLKANPLLKLTMDGNSLDALPKSVSNLASSFHKSLESSINSSMKQVIHTMPNSSTHFINKKGNFKGNEIRAATKAREEMTNTKDLINGVSTKPSVSRSQSVKYTNENVFRKPFSRPNLYNAKADSAKFKSNASVPSLKNTSNRNTHSGNKMQKPTMATSNSKVTNWLNHNTLSKPKNEGNEYKTNSISKVGTGNVVRRSLSAQHFERKKIMLQNDHSNVNKSVTKSSEDLTNVREKHVMLLNTKISPIREEMMNVSFKSPSAYNRRSIVFKTPRTPNTSRRSPSFAESSELAAADLQHKLTEWLKRRSKSIGSFHHLKCFGLHHLKEQIDEENKENIEVVQDLRKGSYEDLKILDVESNNCDSHMNGDEIKVVENDLGIVAKDALSDLHKLVLEGYPGEQCEAWLRIIHQKYKNLEQEPQYWECRAAIEEARGNITSAVECYKTAIVQGAEVQSVDESLDQLLQKFSLLNINTSENEKRKSIRERTRILKDARNVFKSTIIQFAVQKRTLKKQNNVDIENDKKFIVTPVRRSTRSRRSAAYTSTPGMKMCTTLKDLEPSIRESMDFHPNNALC